MNNGKHLVAVSLLGTGVLVVGGKVLSGHLPPYKQLLGIFVAYVGLSLTAEVAPELAGAMAMLVLVVVALETAGDLGPTIGRLLGQTKPTATPANAAEREATAAFIQDYYRTHPEAGRPVSSH